MRCVACSVIGRVSSDKWLSASFEAGSPGLSSAPGCCVNSDGVAADLPWTRRLSNWGELADWLTFWLTMVVLHSLELGHRLENPRNHAEL